LIRDAHHGGVGDRRMAEQELFDLTRIDVLAAADDHLLQADCNATVPTLIHRAQGARVQPALRVDGRCRRFGILEVALHDEIPTCAELTHRVAIVQADHGLMRGDASV
jgi:hypothetical protein